MNFNQSMREYRQERVKVSVASIFHNQSKASKNGSEKSLLLNEDIEEHAFKLLQVDNKSSLTYVYQSVE